jgi:hypothetical protein
MQLSLNGCTFALPVVFEDISLYCTRLRHLELEDCSEATEDALAAVFRRNKRIEYLDIRGNENFSDKLLSYLSLHCPNLSKLFFSNTILVTDKGLQFLANNSKLLKSLWIENCGLITNSGIIMLAGCCTHLRNLTIYKCFSVTEAAQQKINWMNPECTCSVWLA